MDDKTQVEEDKKEPKKPKKKLSESFKNMGKSISQSFKSLWYNLSHPMIIINACARNAKYALTHVNANLIAALIFLGISIYGWVTSNTFRGPMKSEPVGSVFYPRALSIALFIFSLILLVQSIIGTKTSHETYDGLNFFSKKKEGKDLRRMLIAICIVIALAVLWNFLGFLIATPIAVFFLMWVLGANKRPVVEETSSEAVLDGAATTETIEAEGDNKKKKKKKAKKKRKPMNPWLKMVLYSLLAPLVIFIIFYKLLGIQMPLGIFETPFMWIEYGFSLAWYYIKLGFSNFIALF